MSKQSLLAHNTLLVNRPVSNVASAYPFMYLINMCETLLSSKHHNKGVENPL